MARKKTRRKTGRKKTGRKSSTAKTKINEAIKLLQAAKTKV